MNIQENISRIKKMMGLNEQTQQTTANVQQSGPHVMVNNQKFVLQVKVPLLGWKDATINNLTPRPDGGYDIVASLLGQSKKDVVKSDTVQLILKNLNQREIMLPRGEHEKKLVKVN